MTVDTTFLPKTTGLVFGDRLVARANKGRVFLLTVTGDEIVEPPPSMEPITLTVNGIDYNYKEGAALTVLINDPIPVVVTVGGPANPTYSWSARGNNATFSDSTTASTEVTCVAEGLVTITCTLTDNDSLEDQISTVVNFYSVDAL
jgi:hypothetical protein